MQRGGAMLGEKVNTALKPVGLKRYIAGGEVLGAISDILKKGAELWEEKNKIDEQRNFLDTDLLLKNYREKLKNSSSLEEFDIIAGGIDDGIKEYFNKNDSGKKFFNEHGEEILKLNKQDIDKMRVSKEYDFGKNSLDILLAGSQNLLQEATPLKAETLLKRGYDEINKTSFLTDEEKIEYKNKFLRNGIYSLALSDVNMARSEAKKYKDYVKEDMFKKIDEIEKIKVKEKSDLEALNNRKQYMNRLGEAIDLWQMKERGEIKKAEYSVLSLDHNDYLWGDRDENIEGDALSKAYKIVRKLNSGEDYLPQDINDASNYLMKAYRDKKIDFEEVANFQTQLLALDVNRKTKERLLDKEIDEFLDGVLGNDNFNNSYEAKIAMEEKSKIAFKLYDAYYGKKIALFQGFLQQGGSLTPKVERVLKKKALDEIKEEFGYKENAEGSFGVGELKTVFRQFYNGSLDNEVWKEFYKKAPFVEDKKGLLKDVARKQMKKEIFYPRFDSWDEVLEANLEQGDKFYFRGRLAVRA